MIKIDYANKKIDDLITEIIASGEYKFSPLVAESFTSRELVREMSDREKAILTIIIQVDNDIQGMPNTPEKGLYVLALIMYVESLKGKLYNTIILADDRFHVLCSDGNIYYVSYDEALDRCEHCDKKETCKERGGC